MRGKKGNNNGIGWMLSLVVACAAVGGAMVAGVSGAQSGDLHETWDLTPGGVVSVTNISGRIRVTSWDENRVRVDGVKRAARGADPDQVRIEVSAQPSAIHIKTVYPNASQQNGANVRVGDRRMEMRAGRREPRVDVSVDYELRVPRSAVLNSLTSVSGEIVVVGPVAQATARITDGSVTVNDVRGATTLTGASGNITARRIGGALVINTLSGEVLVEATEGSVNANTASGSIRGVDVRADAAFTSASGGIRIEKSAGRVAARTASGPVTVIDAAGAVQAESLSDIVTVENARGRVTASTLNGDLIVRNAQQGVRATAINGEITLTGVSGRIDAGTTSGDISLKETDSREITAKTTSGNISFQGRLQDDGRYHFESFSGEIVAVLPGDSGFNLTAKTYNGTINTEFPIQLAPGANLGDVRTLRGAAGTGGAELITTGYSGSIVLKKAINERRR
ncbi:MAG: DUF4097 family beta strand repeat protein [Blastocatellales bacterium]|nr:DUF4097 family beta strand repeat protein [Blastocatellales bacterium]